MERCVKLKNFAWPLIKKYLEVYHVSFKSVITSQYAMSMLDEQRDLNAHFLLGFRHHKRSPQHSADPLSADEANVAI